jgi:serine/threonine protein kinase/WD40 repeat protein
LPGEQGVSEHDEHVLRLVESILTGSREAEENSSSDASAAEDRQVISRLDEIRRIAKFHHTLQAAGAPVAPPRMWGHLRVCRLLGQGAFADVYLAHDPELDRDVALKLYRVQPLPALSQPPRPAESPPSPGPDPSRLSTECSSLSREGLTSVLREGRLMARVRHPNVVVIHGAEEIDGQVGIWMDYIEGRTLAELLRLQGPLSASEATLVGLDLCRALAAVHAVGILHRDVKAQNVMRERGGRIVLMDFGVGAEVRDGVQGPSGEDFSVHGTSGTPLYMAPETLLEGVASLAADIYSLGVLLFHLVTGAFPVSGTTLSELIEAHRAGRHRLLRDVRPDVSAPFAEAVTKALDPVPEERYSSMGEMERALALAAGVHSTAAAAPSRWSRPGHRQITFSGRAHNPALSPDSRTLAYVWSDERLAQTLSVQDLRGGRPLDLLHGAWFARPKWSPDGSELLVQGEADGSSWTEVYIVPRFGGVPRRYQAVRAPSWLPDGSEFAGVTLETNEFVIVNKSTGYRTTIPLGEHFSRPIMVLAAPRAGRFLIIDSEPSGPASLWILPGAGRAPVRVLVESEMIFSVLWARDASAIYVLKGSPGGGNLFRLQLDRSTCRPIGEPTVVLAGLQARSMSFSDDERTLAYMRRTGHSNLWVAERQSGRPGAYLSPRPITRGTFVYNGPAISPDGERIVANCGQGGVSEIHVIRRADSFVEQVTYLGAYSGWPAWSPDGRRIAFVAKASGELGLWVMNGDGSELRRVEGLRCGVSVRWDYGKRILCQLPDRVNFAWVDPDTGETEPLPREDSPGYRGGPILSPDQHLIALHWSRYTEKGEGAWFVPLDGSPPREICRGLVYPVRWAPDGRSLWLIEELEKLRRDDPPSPEGGPGTFRVHRVSIEGGPPLESFTLPFRLVWDFDIRPDGSWWVCSAAETQSDIWIAEDVEATGN